MTVDGVGGTFNGTGTLTTVNTSPDNAPTIVGNGTVHTWHHCISGPSARRQGKGTANAAFGVNALETLVGFEPTLVAMPTARFST